MDTENSMFTVYQMSRVSAYKVGLLGNTKRNKIVAVIKNKITTLNIHLTASVKNNNFRKESMTVALFINCELHLQVLISEKRTHYQFRIKTCIWIDLSSIHVLK
jgi:hypothetical protein